MRTRSRVTRSITGALAATVAAATLAACADNDSGGGDSDSIVIGSTLSLTGAFAATGKIHQIAGQQFVDRLNANGGLLGRRVEWRVLDDESEQAQVTSLYERLISQDRVDLIVGPYATPNIIAAVAVAERHRYVIPQHTAVLAPLLKYDCQFPGWSIGPAPDEYVPNQLFDAVATLPNPPRRIAIVTSQSGSADFMTYGSAEAAQRAGALKIARDRGLEVVAEVRYPPTTTDWAPIAAKVRDARPDLVINNGLAVDPVNLIQAMAQLNYRPPMMFTLFPAPGPLLGLGDAAQGLLSVSLFEPNETLLDRYPAEAKAVVEEFQRRASAAKLPYGVFETQAAASWNAWQILTAGVTGAGSLDQQKICEHLHANGADTTFGGKLTFDPNQNNFWPSTLGLKQIQGKDWVMVWPADRAAAPLQAPAAS